MNAPPFEFKVPAGLSASERDRLARLAVALWGRLAPCGVVYFTPNRGRKFMALFSAGWDTTPRGFVHPNWPRKFDLAEAVRLAELVRKELNPVAT